MRRRADLDAVRAGLLRLVPSDEAKRSFIEAVEDAFDCLVIEDVLLKDWGTQYQVTVKERIGEQRLMLPFTRLPDGLRCMMLIYAGLLEAGRGTTILVEEPEAHLHVTAIQRLMNLFRREVEDRKLQFVVTTHSPDLVEAALPTEIVRVERTPRGVSLFRRVTNKEGREDTLRYLAGMPR